jgi:hypothetical protein
MLVEDPFGVLDLDPVIVVRHTDQSAGCRVIVLARLSAKHQGVHRLHAVYGVAQAGPPKPGEPVHRRVALVGGGVGLPSGLLGHAEARQLRALFWIAAGVLGRYGVAHSIPTVAGRLG